MRLLTSILVAEFLAMSCNRASAPIGPGLGLALKCIAMGVIVPTAVIIYKCDQNFYLVRYQLEDEDPTYACSKANPNTLAKLGGKRLQGPWTSPEEPTLRAWVNNRDPWFPVFGPSVLGSIPGPNTNAPAFIQLQASVNGGKLWSPIGSTTADPNDNLSFVVLSGTGTNGMSADQLLAFQDCDVAVAGPDSKSAIFRWEIQQQ